MKFRTSCQKTNSPSPMPEGAQHKHAPSTIGCPFGRALLFFLRVVPAARALPFQAFVNNYKYCNGFPRGLLFWNPFSRMGLPFCKGFPFLKDLPFCKDLPFLTGPFSRSICNVFELIGLKWQMCGILAPAALCSFVGVKNTNLQHFGIQPL